MDKNNHQSEAESTEIVQTVDEQSPLSLGANYAVDLPVFQGPLDLLLHLIEKQELDISEVSLVAVTDQYLATINLLEHLEPDSLSDFLVIASRMLYIKSRRLLPKPQPEASGDEEDPSQTLIRQLLEYRQFKQLAGALQQRIEAGFRVYVRTATGTGHPQKNIQQNRLDLGNLDLQALQKAVQRVLRRIPQEPPLPKVKTYVVTVAERVESIRQYIDKMIALSPSDAYVAVEDDDNETGKRASEIRFHFEELLSEAYSRIEVIVTFLAMLELIKLNDIHVSQIDAFGDIIFTPIFCNTTDIIKHDFDEGDDDNHGHNESRLIMMQSSHLSPEQPPQEKQEAQQPRTT